MNNPVADNSSVEGRQKNRRVEIIVSGEVIGTQIGARLKLNDADLLVAYKGRSVGHGAIEKLVRFCSVVVGCDV